MAPSFASAWASVGHVALVVEADPAVVDADAPVVDVEAPEAPDVVVGVDPLLDADPHAATVRPPITIAEAKRTFLFMAKTLRVFAAKLHDADRDEVVVGAGERAGGSPGPTL